MLQEDETMSKYAVIKWKDGYQEVTSLEKESMGIIRYYVIERIEKYGRLAIDSQTNYPGLKVISRKPDEIESITFTEDGQGKVFSLTLKEEKSEGGRVEHHYEVKETGEKGIDEFVSRLRQVLQELKIDPKAAQEKDLENLRRAMKLSCFEKQSEVLSFVKMLLNRCV
jgi:hypothetical protein